MSEQVLTTFIASLTTLLVAAGGWFFAFRIHGQAKKIERLTQRVDRLKEDGRARVALEQVTCEWVAAQQGISPLAAQRMLRDMAYQRHGRRPRLTPVHFLPDNVNKSP